MPAVFCVVCGKQQGDFVLRRSGYKCVGCVGKRSNKHLVKRQSAEALRALQTNNYALLQQQQQLAPDGTYNGTPPYAVHFPPHVSTYGGTLAGSTGSSTNVVFGPDGPPPAPSEAFYLNAAMTPPHTLSSTHNSDQTLFDLGRSHESVLALTSSTEKERSREVNLIQQSQQQAMNSINYVTLATAAPAALQLSSAAQRTNEESATRKGRQKNAANDAENDANYAQTEKRVRDAAAVVATNTTTTNTANDGLSIVAEGSTDNTLSSSTTNTATHGSSPRQTRCVVNKPAPPSSPTKATTTTIVNNGENTSASQACIQVPTSRATTTSNNNTIASSNTTSTLRKPAANTRSADGAVTESTMTAPPRRPPALPLSSSNNSNGKSNTNSSAVAVANADEVTTAAAGEARSEAAAAPTQNGTNAPLERLVSSYLHRMDANSANWETCSEMSSVAPAERRGARAGEQRRSEAQTYFLTQLIEQQQRLQRENSANAIVTSDTSVGNTKEAVTTSTAEPNGTLTRNVSTESFTACPFMVYVDVGVSRRRGASASTDSSTSTCSNASRNILVKTTRKFSETRHVSRKHTSLNATATSFTSAASPSSVTLETDGIRVSKLAVRLTVTDRTSHGLLSSVELRPREELLPALDKLRDIARTTSTNSGAVVLPAAPMKHALNASLVAPSHVDRFRDECQTFFDAALRLPAIAHSVVLIKLLHLPSSYLTQGEPTNSNNTTATEAERPRQTSVARSVTSLNAGGSGVASGLPVRSEAAANAKKDSNSNTTNTINRTSSAALPPRKSGAMNNTSSSHIYSGPLSVTAASGDTNTAAAHNNNTGSSNSAVSVAAKKADAPMDDSGNTSNKQKATSPPPAAAAPAALTVAAVRTQGDFNRTESTLSLSVMSTTTLAARRSALDEITPEDLQHVELGPVIGRGTFGVVYTGWVQTDKGPCTIAVKLRTLGVNESDTIVQNMQEEADILQSKNHENIVRCLGGLYVPERREFRIFTEYIECGTIRTMIDRFGCLTFSAIKSYMKQILRGLAYLHANGVLHCDIKSQNILVDKHGRVMLSDFGCSVQTSDQTTWSKANGTPMWQSPERLAGQDPTAAADIWSVGCVGIEMLKRDIWNFDASCLGVVRQINRLRHRKTLPDGLPTEDELRDIQATRPAAEYEVCRCYCDLLHECLRLDPSERASAEALLGHAFFTLSPPPYLRWRTPPTKEQDKSRAETVNT